VLRRRQEEARLGKEAIVAKLKLRCVVGNYESTRPLRERAIEAEGVDFEFPNYPGYEDLHRQVAHDDICDVGEFNCPAYVGAASRDWFFTGLPLFLHRRFRHGFIFINKDKGISKPSDLAGKKIGCPIYQPAACVWLRGLLQNDYGVPPESVTWVTNDPEIIEFERPASLRIEKVRPAKNVDDMFTDGEIDAVFSPNFPKAWLAKQPNIARLWPNFKELEIDWYKRTGLFPIMHCTIVKRDIVEKNPWVVKSLMDAFEKSKQLSYKHLTNPRIVPLAWYQSYWEEERAFLGPDPWEYGVTSAANRKNVELICRYVHQQYMSARLMKVDELWPKEALSWTAPKI
jgi:4,5-dihydroxyphthalate decarboxylase